MDNTDSLDQTLTKDLEAIGRALKMYSDYVERIMESIRPTLIKVLEMISEILEHIESLIDEIIKAYSLIELSIPNSSISVYDFDSLSQAPPVREKSIKEMALENLKYNMNRYNNHKLTKIIKRELPALVRELIYGYISYLFFKALGMQ